MERTNWAGFVAAERDFATTVERRFTAYTHHVLATLRRDGAPRLTGIEATFRDGELWLGMMPGSRKARDLRRDGRCSLMANPGPDTEAMLADGDARIAGRAVETSDEAAVRRYLRGQEPAPEVFHLFRVEPTEVVTTGVDGDRLVLHSWTPARGLVTIRRGNGEEPVEIER